MFQFREKKERTALKTSMAGQKICRKNEQAKKLFEIVLGKTSICIAIKRKRPDNNHENHQIK